MPKELKELLIKHKGTLIPMPATKHLVLYKYFSTPDGNNSFAEANLENLILRNQIRLSCNYEVNDPVDTSPYIDRNFTKKELQIYLNNIITNESNDLSTEQLRKELLSSIKNRKDRMKFLKENQLKLENMIIQIWRDSFLKSGFTCLTENWSNRLMWSHYAQSHQGLCIGFRTRPNSNDKSLPFAGHFLPVQYRKKKTRLEYEENDEWPPTIGGYQRNTNT